MNAAGNPLWRMLEGEWVNNQYHLQEYLGAGGFGAVYRAHETVGNQFIRTVAIKLILIHDLNAQLGELQTAVNLRHENLLTCYTSGETTLAGNRGQFLYLVMELADQSLEQLQGNGVIAPERLRPIVRDVARGLQALHRENRVHRDLKPGNVLRVGQAWKIGDFGLARQLSSQASHDSTAHLAGTVMYVPPEAFRGEVSTAWDVWSLGVMIVYLLTGELPYRPYNTFQELQQRVMNCQLRIPRLPSPHQEVVAGCLQRDRRRRWTAAQVLAVLGSMGSGGGRTPVVVSQGVPWLWLVVALFVGVGVTTGFNQLFAEQPTSEPTETPTVLRTPPATPTPTPPPTPPPTPTPTPPPMHRGIVVEPFSYTTARVSRTGDVTTYPASSPIGRYVERGVSLPSGAVELAMVAIPGGTFTMGSPDSEAERFSSEEPQHEVTLPDFFMGQYEVTQAQYEAVMGNNPAYFDSNPNNPVEQVSWEDAAEFCRRLSQITGRTYRLPTEAEWEYAARAGTTTPFAYGETIVSSVVNYDGDYPYGDAPEGEDRNQTIPVNDLYPNPWGLFHMHGNVWEWTQDEYHESYQDKLNAGLSYLRQDGSQPWLIDTNVLSDDQMVLRGGSWYYSAWSSRSAYRVWFRRDDRVYYNGFRVVLE